MVKVLLSLVFMFVSSHSYAVCMTELDAELYECRYLENENFDNSCAEKHGEEFKMYLTTSECSEEIGAELRGEEYAGVEADGEMLVDAVCLTYEQGQKNKCEFWDYEPAYMYCSQKFGDRFLPHLKSNECTEELADDKFGYVDSSLLVEGLDSEVEEVEAIMTLIDREQIKTSLGGLVSSRPVIGHDFYSLVMQGLLSKLVKIKTELYRRSKLKVRFEGDNVKKFIEYSARYLALITRVHKVYAYAAHRNHKKLKTYKFENLNELNLKLKKDFALEILAKVNFKVANSYSGEYVTFFESEQNKQLYEYHAIAEPKTPVDYAKLLVFLGARENLTNLWAVDRLTPRDMFDKEYYSCGNFLTLRPENSSSVDKIPVVLENKAYDLFAYDYLPRVKDLVKATREVNLFDGEKGLEALADTFGFNKVIMKVIAKKNDISEYTSRKKLESYLKEDLAIILDAEKNHWAVFSEYHFKTIVLPGDDIQNLFILKRKIIDAVYKERVKAISETFLGLYPWVSDQEAADIKEDFERSIFLDLKKEFSSKLQAKFDKVFEGYNDSEKKGRENFKAKVEETVKVAKSALRAANITAKLNDGRYSAEKMRPRTLQELMLLFESKIARDYQDVKKSVDEDSFHAELLSGFFHEVAEKFNKKYLKPQYQINKEELAAEYEVAAESFEIKGDNLVNKENGEKVISLEEAGKKGFVYSLGAKMTGSDDERSKDLWKFLFESASNLYENGKFEIRNVALVPDAVRLSEDREEIERNPYRIQVYQDGTPVALTVTEFYETFQKTLDLEIPRRAVSSSQYKILGIEWLENNWDRSNIDEISAGSFNLPQSYIDKKGVIRYKNDKSYLANKRTLERLYKQSVVLTKAEMREAGQVKLSEEERILEESKPGFIGSVKEFFTGGDKIILSSKFFARVFEVFNIPVGKLAKNRHWGDFANSKEDQLFLAAQELSQAYQKAPILRNTIETTESFEKTQYYAGYNTGGSYTTTVREKKKRPLLHKIAMEAYNPYSKEMDEKNALRLTRSTIFSAIRETPGKLQSFCEADYMNYLKDRDYKKAFQAAVFLREKLKSPLGSTQVNAVRIRKMDEKMVKDLRSKYTAIVEDYVTPFLIYFGTATLVALGILLMIGTAGAAGVAIPGIIAGGAKILSAFIALDLYLAAVFIPMTAASLQVRLNSQFIEVPAQLRFQESLANSQVDYAKSADHDMIDQTRAQNKTSQKWTIGLMPLEFFYGFTAIKHVRKIKGISGRAAFKKLTGMKLRPFSAPVRSMGVTKSFRSLRKEIGMWKAIKSKVKGGITKYRARGGRYYDIPEEMIKSVPLRMGIILKLEKLKLAHKPWFILDDVEKYTKSLKERLSNYNSYRSAEKSLVIKTYLKGGLQPREMWEFGLKYSNVPYVPASMIRALKQKRFGEYFRNFGRELGKLKIIQGKLINDRIKVMEGITKKLHDTKKAALAGRIDEADIMDDFFRKLSDKEVLALNIVAKRSDGVIRHLKGVFKQHKVLVESLRPMSYLYGHVGRSFSESIYKNDPFLDLREKMDKVLDDDVKDIANFYESVMKHYGHKGEGMNQLREGLEHEFGRHAL